MKQPISKAQFPGELLRELARLYTRAQRVVAECCRTSTTQCHLLVELGRAGPLPLTDLGARLSLEKSWGSRAVDGLVERGWGTKEPNPLDARSWLVTLTADGEDRVRELNATLERRIAERTAELTASEACLRTLVDHAPEAIVDRQQYAVGSKVDYVADSGNWPVGR